MLDCSRNIRSRLASLRGAVLAMAGGASPVWACDAVQTLAQALPHAEARVIAGERHGPADNTLSAIVEALFA